MVPTTHLFLDPCDGGLQSCRILPGSHGLFQVGMVFRVEHSKRQVLQFCLCGAETGKASQVRRGSWGLSVGLCTRQQQRAWRSTGASSYTCEAAARCDKRPGCFCRLGVIWPLSSKHQPPLPSTDLEAPHAQPVRHHTEHIQGLLCQLHLSSRQAQGSDHDERGGHQGRHITIREQANPWFCPTLLQGPPPLTSPDDISTV